MHTYLVTGSQGFIGSFVCEKILAEGHRVVGIDDYSKYGRLVRAHDRHHKFSLHEIDLASPWAAPDMKKIVAMHKPRQVVCLAAKIGGISYFHDFPYDIIAKNDRIMSNTYEACMGAGIERMIVSSSSMVYESATCFPCKEGDVASTPPPVSSYGFQKLACEYYARAAWDQYKVPYTVLRPFNCVGVGEDKALLSSTSGNVTLTLSHVLPDLVHKVLSGQDPLHILGDGRQVRCFTHGSDLAEGFWLAMQSERAVNETFNLSTPVKTTILELAELVWGKIRSDKFRYVCGAPFRHDVQFRLPDTTRARQILGFEAKVGLEQAVDEVIDHVRRMNFT